QVIKEPADPLDAIVFTDDRLSPPQAVEPVESVETSLEVEVSEGWKEFKRNARGEWKAFVDRRSGKVEVAEGAGIPWVPGRGNGLTADDIAQQLGNRKKPDLAVLDSIARGQLQKLARFLGVDPKSLVLNQGRSGQPSDHLWFVDYDVTRDGLVVEGARVVFRVNGGNLIQFGTENLPPAHVPTPRAKVSREEALAVLSRYAGVGAGDTLLDAGSLRLLPVATEDGPGRGFAFGRGRGLAAVWQFTFQRDGSNGTWRARVDAATGQLLEFVDVNEYAQVTGGARILGTSTNLPMPFANLSTGGFTNSAGVYSFGGGAVSSTLAGQFVRISDNCGAISLAADASGNIAFGTSGGADCTTPGFGGAGNTHSSRTQFYHVNRAKEIARGWLPTNSWLNAQLTANVNINQTCNAFWNGSTINFYRSGGGCGNTGEIEGVSLHEYGHGLDSNDGNGSAPDNGTGETYGDFTAALATHSSCIGSGFLGSNCGGYGDSCTSCTGVRDIDWAKHASNTPHTVANFTQARCPTSAIGYVGPCNREGHCESYVSSEALWDLANRDLPNPGSGAAWSIVDRLWYLSRSTATAAFSCNRTVSPFTSNGCNTGSLWRTLRAVDDDDGNLANGTPHGGALFAAFNRHGIACTTDAGANVTFAGCTAPAVPTLSLSGGNNQVSVSWTNSGTGVVYDVYRNERGCNSGFIKAANDVSSTAFTDSAVANGFTYFYQVVAQPSGNEACAAAPSACQSVTPSGGGGCTPPAAPTGLTATAASSSQINLSWSAVSGATEYRIYRSTTSGGPYTQVGTSTTTSFSNTGLSCNTTYYYVVRAFNNCESANSNQASATTSACTGCTTTTLYSKGFETDTGLAGWSTGTFVSFGSTASWRGVQTCTAHGGTKIFRYGGLACTDNYGNNNFNFAQPNGSAGIAVPAGSTTTRLSFWHRRAYETGFDGGTLTVSVDGTNYFYVPASAILSGATYNGTVAPDCAPSGAAGASVFTGIQSTFVNTVVNLDAACNAATGGTGGCAGRSVRIGFTSITDCSVTDDGWFIDDLTVTACTP
ncbi:MAG TPA: fibronectin type III domain-containing protein, partial [Thermoanaerobaculia bacterium]